MPAAPEVPAAPQVPAAPAEVKRPPADAIAKYLPRNWYERVSKTKGKTLYYNPVTKETHGTLDKIPGYAEWINRQPDHIKDAAEVARKRNIQRAAQHATTPDQGLPIDHPNYGTGSIPQGIVERRRHAIQNKVGGSRKKRKSTPRRRTRKN